MNTPPRTPESRQVNITNIQSLKNALHGLINKWALSGSHALKLHANALGLQSRVPRNIDIVVNRNNARNFLHAFFLSGYTQTTPVILRKVNKVTVKKGNSSIDILFSGALGPRLTENSKTVINGIPVLRIKNLLLQKRKSNWSPNQVKNIKLLEELSRIIKRRA